MFWICMLIWISLTPEKYKYWRLDCCCNCWEFSFDITSQVKVNKSCLIFFLLIFSSSNLGDRVTIGFIISWLPNNQKFCLLLIPSQKGKPWSKIVFHSIEFTLIAANVLWLITEAEDLSLFEHWWIEFYPNYFFFWVTDDWRYY